MKTIAPYLANGRPRTCWGCGNPFVVRNGRSEAIVGFDGQLYCYGTGCGEDALASEILNNSGPAATFNLSHDFRQRQCP